MMVVVAAREQVAGGASAVASSEKMGSVSRLNPGKASMPAKPIPDVSQVFPHSLEEAVYADELERILGGIEQFRACVALESPFFVCLASKASPRLWFPLYRCAAR